MLVISGQGKYAGHFCPHSNLPTLVENPLHKKYFELREVSSLPTDLSTDEIIQLEVIPEANPTQRAFSGLWPLLGTILKSQEILSAAAPRQDNHPVSAGAFAQTGLCSTHSQEHHLIWSPGRNWCRASREGWAISLDSWKNWLSEAQCSAQQSRGWLM